MKKSTEQLKSEIVIKVRALAELEDSKKAFNKEYNKDKAELIEQRDELLKELDTAQREELTKDFKNGDKKEKAD